MLAFLTSLATWAFFSLYLWPHLIHWTSGWGGNWLAMFFVVTWPLIIISLPAMVAISLGMSTIKDITKR